MWHLCFSVPRSACSTQTSVFLRPQIRLFNPDKGTVSRVARGRLLEEGDVLLFPRDALDATGHAGSPATSHQSGEGAGKAKRSISSHQSLPRLPVVSPAAAGWDTGPAARAGPPIAWARRLILEHTEDIIFVNKPAGVDVQGPNPDSIEALMAGPLRLSPLDDLK